MQNRYPNGLPAKLAAGVRVITDLAKRGAGLGRGPNRGNKLPGAAWAGTWPAPGATLDLDFANNRGFVRGVGMGGAMDAVTFTRASNGTFVGSDGKLAGSGGNQGALGLNLLTFPQDFDNAAWSKGNTSITANVAIAPDGTATADLVTPTTASSLGKSIAQTAAMNGTYTFSIYCQFVSQQFVQIYTGTDANPVVNYDLLNGTYSVPSGAATGSITSAGNGWYRITATFTTTTAGSIAIAYANSLSTARASGVAGTNTFNIWGAQLELGSTATTYYPTNISTPRFDWASTATVATNLVAYSEQFNNAYWTKFNTTISADTTETTDPLGGNTADKYTATGASSGILLNSIVPIGVYSFSLYFKAGNQNNVSLLISTSGNGRVASFNLSSVTASIANQGTGGTVSGGTAEIESVGNGWYRCKLEGVTTTAINGIVLGGSGTNGETLYIWGAQLISGATAGNYQATGAYLAANTPLAAASTCNGLLIEESRTNRILWCRDATQSNWTKTNVTAAKDQTGIDGVANAASSLTASADNATCIQTITLASGSRTGSVYLKRITGTGNVQVSLDGSTWSTVDLSSTEWRRIVLSGTVTNPVVGIRLATNGDAVAMDYAQVEDGAFATTPILTTSATATRSADVGTIQGANFSQVFSRDRATFYGSFSSYINGYCFGIYSSAAEDTILALNNSGQARFAVVSNNVNVVDISGGAVGATASVRGNFKLAASLCRDNFAFYSSGILIGTDSGGNMPFPLQMSIGYRGQNGANYANGCINRIFITSSQSSMFALQNLST